MATISQASTRLYPPRVLLRRAGVLALVAVPLLWVARQFAADSTGTAVTLLNGFTAASLYFLVAAGFTLSFGLMRITNLAHGSLYLLGGYFGYSVVAWSGNWFLALVGAVIGTAATGLLMEQALLRWVRGDDLREALVTIGVMVIVADQALALWGSEPLDIGLPSQLGGPLELPGGLVFSKYRLLIVLLALIIGGGMWALMNRTKLGLAIRAGVDDRAMLGSIGVNTRLLFAFVFALGAALAGFAGVTGGSYLSIAPGEDSRYLLISLIVVIVGGMGSLAGAALGATLVGVVEAFAQVYLPTYSVLITFGVMVAILAVRPNGLLGRRS